MSKLISIRAYKYAELNDKAKENFIHKMWDMPFDYEDEDGEGNPIIKYDVKLTIIFSISMANWLDI